SQPDLRRPQARDDRPLRVGGGSSLHGSGEPRDSPSTARDPDRRGRSRMGTQALPTLGALAGRRPPSMAAAPSLLDFFQDESRDRPCLTVLRSPHSARWLSPSLDFPEAAEALDASTRFGFLSLPTVSDWLPKRSLPALLRAVRATAVMVGLFAITD